MSFLFFKTFVVYKNFFKDDIQEYLTDSFRLLYKSEMWMWLWDMKLFFSQCVVALGVFVFNVNVIFADTYRLPAEEESVIGDVQFVKARYEDTFSDIARRYNLGYNELVLANPGVDPWLPGEGTSILIPTLYVLPDAPREGLVLNVPEMRIYYFPEERIAGEKVVMTYPVSVGRVEWNTPLGLTKVTKKQRNPTWYPPESIRKEHAERGEPLPKVVPPGPDNPLGNHAIRLAIPSYLIHGTNRPYGIGMRVTHGCVRMYPEDISVLFNDVHLGTPVHIVNQPYKAGWRAGKLFIESHPPLEEDLAKYQKNRTPIIKAIVQADKREGTEVMWEQVLEVAEAENGLPAAVATSSAKNIAAALE